VPRLFSLSIADKSIFRDGHRSQVDESFMTSCLSVSLSPQQRKKSPFGFLLASRIVFAADPTGKVFFNEIVIRDARGPPAGSTLCSPIDDHGIAGRLVAVAAALLVAAAAAHHLVGQQDAAHFRVLVLSLVDDRLLRDGVDQPHEDVLLLSRACKWFKRRAES
jgi:hypothetical protein